MSKEKQTENDLKLGLPVPGMSWNQKMTIIADLIENQMGAELDEDNQRAFYVIGPKCNMLIYCRWKP
jgi:hypothetical protein